MMNYYILTGQVDTTLYNDINLRLSSAIYGQHCKKFCPSCSSVHIRHSFFFPAPRCTIFCILRSFKILSSPPYITIANCKFLFLRDNSLVRHHRDLKRKWKLEDQLYCQHPYILHTLNKWNRSNKTPIITLVAINDLHYCGGKMATMSEMFCFVFLFFFKWV